MGENYTNLSKEELIEKLKSKDEQIADMSKSNEDLIKRMQEEFKTEKDKMRNERHCMQTEFDKKTGQIISETNKRIAEIRDDGKELIRIISKYV